MTEGQEKKPIEKLPRLESTPIKFWHGEKEKEFDVIIELTEGQSKADGLFEKLKEITGVEDTELAANIIDTAESALEPLTKKKDRLNVITQTLHDFGPSDAIEARLVLQASVLFTYGMNSLNRSAATDIINHSEYHTNKAIKLLRLHNETIEALNRYKRGGTQKIVVQHNLMAEKAIVNNFTAIEGVTIKNGGETPCSGNYAAQKQEPMAINHVDSQLWQMENVDCMEAKAQVQKQKRGKNC